MSIQYKDETATPEMKTAIDVIQRSFEEFKAANDKRIDDIAKGKADVLTEEKVNKINADLSAQQKAIEDLIKKTAIRAGAEDKKTGRTEHQKAFDAYVRKGDAAGVEAIVAASPELKALSVGSNPDGGYLAPVELDREIMRIAETVSAMRSVAQVITIGGQAYKKLINRGGAASGWVGETETRAETATPTLSQMDFPAMEVYARPFTTQQALDDSFINVEQWLAEEVSIEFAAQEGAAFVSGNGTNRPRGINSYNVVANASYAWGSVGFVASGAAGAFSTANAADRLIDLMAALRQGYRPGARWMMNRLVDAEIRKLKDGNGQYLWAPGIAAGAPVSLLGYPVTIDDNMPDIAANSLSILFGDFRRAYLIVDRMGVRTLRDPFSNKPFVEFYTTKRVGGGIQNFEAVKAMRFSVS
jgi:HK97 family phage major capsid protein